MSDKSLSDKSLSDKSLRDKSLRRSRSHKLFERASALMPGGVNSPVRAFKSVGSEPFMVERGEGAYLIDADGNRYVDYVCSWGPLVLGHAHPAVVEALGAQAARGTSFGACHAAESDLAEVVRELFPAVQMIRFVNSGTEAGMGALRLARAFTGRPKILKFSGCYHGHTDSLLVQAGSGVATLGLPDSKGVPASATKDTLVVPYNDVENVRALFRESGSEIAAVIVEPVLGNAGMILPEPGFLETLREETRSHGALLIFDEVMSGFRVKLGGAEELYGIEPDLVMLGKVIGGGLPVGAFGGRREIMQLLAPLGPVYQAGTLSGNPLAMAAGLATLAEWRKPGVFERAADGAARLVAAMRSEAKAAGVPFCAASCGTMFGFFFQRGPVRSYEDAKGSDQKAFVRFFHAALERGVYFAPSAFEAGFVSAAHDGAALDHTLAALPELMLAARG